MKKITKKNKSALPSDVERARMKDVLPHDVFIVSKAQGFEAEREGHLMSKVSVISSTVQKMHASGYMKVTLHTLVPEAVFNEGTKVEDIQNNLRAYAAIELDSSLINPAIALTALSKQEAVVIQTTQNGQSWKIIDLNKEES